MRRRRTHHTEEEWLNRSKDKNDKAIPPASRLTDEMVEALIYNDKIIIPNDTDDSEEKLLKKIHLRKIRKMLNNTDNKTIIRYMKRNKNTYFILPKRKKLNKDIIKFILSDKKTFQYLVDKEGIESIIPIKCIKDKRGSKLFINALANYDNQYQLCNPHLSALLETVKYDDNISAFLFAKAYINSYSKNEIDSVCENEIITEKRKEKKFGMLAVKNMIKNMKKYEIDMLYDEDNISYANLEEQTDTWINDINTVANIIIKYPEVSHYFPIQIRSKAFFENEKLLEEFKKSPEKFSMWLSIKGLDELINENNLLLYMNYYDVFNELPDKYLTDIEFMTKIIKNYDVTIQDNKDELDKYLSNHTDIAEALHLLLEEKISIT